MVSQDIPTRRIREAWLAEVVHKTIGRLMAHIQYLDSVYIYAARVQTMLEAMDTDLEYFRSRHAMSVLSAEKMYIVRVLKLISDERNGLMRSVPGDVWEWKMRQDIARDDARRREWECKNGW